LAGFGVASPLDTGWALAAQLQNMASSDKANAIAWVQANQRPDGAFAIAGTPDLLTTAIITRGLRTKRR
jgi:hypothetical protein